jgi:hypothetical protein
MATDTEKCCGVTCISADLDCCETDPVPGWCNYPTDVCQPCPAGQTCYAQDINTGEEDVVSWACCGSDVCTFTVSSGTLVSTISAASSQTSPSISVSSSIVTYSAQTTSTLPASSTSTTSAFTSFVPAPTSSIPPWNGTGPLLVGYCATPEFSLVYGPQPTAVYFIGVVGCVGEKTECCPFQVSSTTSTVTTTETQTVGAGPSTINQFLFPTPASSSQITLPHCPEDYETVSSVCCPS